AMGSSPSAPSARGENTPAPPPLPLALRVVQILGRTPLRGGEGGQRRESIEDKGGPGPRSCDPSSLSTPPYACARSSFAFSHGQSC
ncbi:MAG: hypothetical protein ACREX3_17165, partial [Gammaproteobacteria bacterium]